MAVIYMTVETGGGAVAQRKFPKLKFNLPISRLVCSSLHALRTQLSRLDLENVGWLGPAAAISF
jgi:hypothetical protein